MSKIYEKLILQRLWDVTEKHKIDLTGETQHCFKPKRSTITACLALQSIISRAIDEKNYVAVASLDLSAAFEVVDRTLLNERLKIMGLPDDVRKLIEDWLSSRCSYVVAYGHTTYMEESNTGTVQGSVLGPILFSLFIRPVNDIEEITTYADDNYVYKIGGDIDVVLDALVGSVELISQWLKDSGLKVNKSKTELCIFNRNPQPKRIVTVDNHKIESKKDMNILGIKFDENLKWTSQIDKAISESNKILHGIRIIKKFFGYDERKDLLTSLYFSKLYYGAEVWHLPNLSHPLKKSLKKASANALRMCTNAVNIFSTHTEIHKATKRSNPDE
jgi:hypothetical protein